FVRWPDFAARSHRPGRFADQRTARARRERKVQRNRFRTGRRRRRRGDDELSGRSFERQRHRANADCARVVCWREFGIGGRADLATSVVGSNEIVDVDLQRASPFGNMTFSGAALSAASNFGIKRDLIGPASRGGTRYRTIASTQVTSSTRKIT